MTLEAGVAFQWIASERPLPRLNIQRLQDEIVVQKSFRKLPPVRMPLAIRRVVFPHEEPAMLFDHL